MDTAVEMLAQWTALLNQWPVETAEKPLRILLACFLGALVGAERDRHGRSAGLRTQLLVCLGSSLAMLVSIEFAEVFAVPGVPDVVRLDPARVAYGVMGGIGFLGAGVIIQDRAGVKGITTAASLWCIAAIGLACGLGMYAVAVFATGMTIFALLVLHRLGERISAQTIRSVQVIVRSTGQTNNLKRFEHLLAAQGTTPSYSKYVRNNDKGTETILYRIRARDVDLLDIATACSQDENVIQVTIS